MSTELEQELFAHHLRENYENADEIIDHNGDLRDGVEIIDSSTNETVRKAEPSPCPLDERTRSDYFDLRDVLLKQYRHDIVNHVKTMDRKRIVLLREHFLQLMSYDGNPHTVDVCHGIVCIMTRLMLGDEESDISMENTDFGIGECPDEDENDDQEEEPLIPNKD